MLDIYSALWNLVSQIPSGKVSTYKALAEALGDVNIAVAVGRLLNNNPKPIIIPCHRVVRSNSELGGYKFGTAKKILLLRSEGVEIENQKIKKFRKIIFRDFRTDYPLKKLRALQKKLACKVILEDKFKKLELVAGMDVSYHDNLGVCAYVALDYETKEILEVKVISRKINFPYIPTYLAFRELPLIKEILGTLRKKPDILIIDGNGVLHPLGIGLASHAGVVMNIPTIGVAKNLLCGKVEKMPKLVRVFSEIFYNSKLAGFCLKTLKMAKPIYISPGHKVSFKTANEIVKYFSVSRIPEPIKLADSISRRIIASIKTK